MPKLFMHVMILILLLVDFTAQAAELPTMAAIALKNNTWSIVVCNKGTCKTVKTDFEPRTFDYDPRTGSLLYVASDGTLRLKSNGHKEKILHHVVKDAYTEPRFMGKGTRYLYVKLLERNSRHIEIISERFDGSQQRILLYRHGTELDPFVVGRHLLYAHVSCVEGCGRIIQEIWDQVPLGGASFQVTKLGTLTHQPSYDPVAKRYYFSFFTPRGYRIGAFQKGDCREAKFSEPERGSATWPMPDGAGGIYYLWDPSAGKTQLIYRNFEGERRVVSLPIHYKKLRNLKVYSW